LIASTPPAPNTATQLALVVQLDFSTGPAAGQLYTFGHAGPTAAQFTVAGGTKTVVSAAYGGTPTTGQVNVTLSALGTNPTSITYTSGGFAPGLSLYGKRFGADPSSSPTPVADFTLPI